MTQALPPRSASQDGRVAHRQPCCAALQPQLGPQAHAGRAEAAAVGVASDWQPQRQLAPGQLTHWHAGFEGVFMELSFEVDRTVRTQPDPWNAFW